MYTGSRQFKKTKLIYDRFSPLCIYVLSFGSSFFSILRKGSPGDDPFFSLSCQHQRGHRHPLLVILARPRTRKVQFRPTQADPTNRCKTDSSVPPFQKRTFVTCSSSKYTRMVDSKCPQIKQHSMAPSPVGGGSPAKKSSEQVLRAPLIVEALLSLSYTEFSQGRPQLSRGGPFLIISSSSPFSTPLPRHKKASETLLSPCILSSSLLFLPSPPQSGLTQSAPAYATGNTYKRRGRRRKTEKN